MYEDIVLCSVYFMLICVSLTSKTELLRSFYLAYIANFITIVITIGKRILQI